MYWQTDTNFDACTWGQTSVYPMVLGALMNQLLCCADGTWMVRLAELEKAAVRKLKLLAEPSRRHLLVLSYCTAPLDPEHGAKICGAEIATLCSALIAPLDAVTSRFNASSLSESEARLCRTLHWPMRANGSQLATALDMPYRCQPKHVPCTRLRRKSSQE